MNEKLLNLIPHRSPMLLLDDVVSYDNDSAQAVKTFVGDEGWVVDRYVCDSILIECLSQTAAVMQGGRARAAGGPIGMGMLVAVKGFKFFRRARPGTELLFSIQVTRRMGAFTLTIGQVTQDEDLLAQGELRFYVDETLPAAEAL